MKNENWKNKKKVMYSLKAPRKLAVRPSKIQDRQQYRSEFMRDRDRILYCKAFRRLSGKTQVYLSGSDDHKRTRLTHTLEVAQIAKTIALELRLDVDLTEGMALGHDIGHTPFGHAGERMLHQIMTPTKKKDVIDSPYENINNGEYKKFYGFKHNLQSVCVALSQEKDYGDTGLDLTNFTLYGMAAHSSKEYKNDPIKKSLSYYAQYDKYMKLPNSNNLAWSFEAYVVKEADEIAQRHHDIEDAIRGKLLSKEEVVKQITNCFRLFFRSSERKILREIKNTYDEETSITLLSRLLVNLFVTRIIRCSIYNMNKFIVDNNLNEKKFSYFLLNNPQPDVERIISYDYVGDETLFKNAMKEFENSISTRVLSSYDIQKSDACGQYIIRKIFAALYKTPSQLPDHCIIEFYLNTKKMESDDIQEIIRNNGIGELRSRFYNLVKGDKLNIEDKFTLMRTICNQIAGMTDSYATKIYNSLYN